MPKSGFGCEAQQGKKAEHRFLPSAHPKCRRQDRRHAEQYGDKFGRGGLKHETVLKALTQFGILAEVNAREPCPPHAVGMETNQHFVSASLEHARRHHEQLRRVPAHLAPFQIPAETQQHAIDMQGDVVGDARNVNRLWAFRRDSQIEIQAIPAELIARARYFSKAIR